MSTHTTCAPSFANSVAVARPIPDAAPVTSTTLSATEEPPRVVGQNGIENRAVDARGFELRPELGEDIAVRSAVHLLAHPGLELDDRLLVDPRRRRIRELRGTQTTHV